MKNLYFFWILFLVTTNFLHSTIRYVPSQFPSIQQAINSSNNGDTILVSPGTYNENINFSGKRILLKSIGLPGSSIINGNKLGPVVKFISGENNQAIIDGFKIINGEYSYGGGIYCTGSSPIIRYCIITGNYGFYSGGIGLWSGSNAIIYNCLIYSNGAVQNTIDIDQSSPTIINCTIVKNGGHAILCWNSGSAQIYNNVIAFNSGYGIYRMTGTNPILKSNCFYSDTAGSYYNISSGQGDFSSNPNFISYELNDFHLSNSSSCKDRGNNSLLLTWTLYDLDGNSRIYNAVVDVGAFEYRNINTNYSLQFDGNSDYVEIPDADVLSPSNFTIELWLKQPVVSSGRRNFYVAKANTSTQEYDFVDQSLIAGEEGLYAFVGNTYFMTTSHPVSNQWTHIAVTFNTALNKIEIFNNGISLGTDTTTQEVVNTNLNLFFGWVPGQPTYNGFIGLIDQIRISSIVRYTSSFNVSYSNFPNDASTVGLWYFNEGTGLTVYDQSGNNNHGTIHGATWSTDVPNYQTDTTTTWRMQIKAQIGSTTDLENFAGVADSATEGFDSNFDSPEPPNAPGNYITAYFNHPEWNPTLGSRFAKDIKKNTALADTVKRWFFDVETNVINDTVTLTFVNDRIPSSFGKYLTDLSNGKRINLKTTSVYKYYNTSTVSKKFMLIIGDSTTPQVSMLKPNGSEIFRSGTTKNITWQSSDGIGIDSIFVYTSSNSGTNYNLLKQIGSVQTTNWQIPNEYLNNNYSVKLNVRDSLGNQTTIKSAKTFTVVGDSLANNSSAGWSLFSLPLIPYDSTTTAIFGDDITSNPFYVWGYYQNSGYSSQTYLKFGNGYWLGLLASNTWDVKGLTVENDSTIQPLAVGYNIIGTNYVRKLNKNTLSFGKNDIQYSFASAVTNGWISNTIYSYDGSGYVSKDTLDLFKGYWLGVIQDSIKLIEKPIESLTVPSVPKLISPTNWEVPFMVNANNLQDKIAVIGVRENASNGFDVQFDSPRPPRNPGNNYLEIYFEHSGGNYPIVLGTKYAKDYKAPGNTTWSFKVESSSNNQALLSWDRSQIKILPDTIQVYLKDMLIGNQLNMRVDSVYSFNYNAIRNFTVNATITDVRDFVTTPTEYSLSQNYPNPFNPTTTIKYALPFESNVKLSVYNLLGEKVKELVNTIQQAGYQEINFNGQGLPSGIYFYSIEASSLDGKNNFRDVKKLIVLK